MNYQGFALAVCTWCMPWCMCQQSERRNVEGRFRRGGFRGIRDIFFNETIRANFLIKRLNKKIEVYCLIKTPHKTSKTTPMKRRREEEPCPQPSPGPLSHGSRKPPGFTVTPSPPGAQRAATPAPSPAPYPPPLPHSTSNSARTASAPPRERHRNDRFDERLHHIGGIPFSAVLLRGESASSSQIENLTVSARRLSLAVLGASGSKVALTPSWWRAMFTPCVQP